MNKGYGQELQYEVVEHIKVLSVGSRGWKKELNLVRWGSDPDAEARYDIRSWNSDRSKMSKGITLTDEEMRNLVKAVEGDF